MAVALSLHQSMTTVAHTTIFGPVHDNGTFTPASAVPAPPAVLTDPSISPSPLSPTVRRGYEPAAVDAHVALLAESADRAAGRARGQRAPPRDGRAARGRRRGGDPGRPVRASARLDTGFGARAERMLRLAETRGRADPRDGAPHGRRGHRTGAQRSRTPPPRRPTTAHRRDRARRGTGRPPRGRAAGTRERSWNSAWSGHGRRRTRCASAAERAADAHRRRARRPTSRSSAAARPTSSAGPARRPSASWRRLRELQGVARAELTRIAAAIRAELRPDEPPLAAPHPTRRPSATGGGARRPGRSANPRAARPTTPRTPHRFVTAGR